MMSLRFLQEITWLDACFYLSSKTILKSQTFCFQQFLCMILYNCKQYILRFGQFGRYNKHVKASLRVLANEKREVLAFWFMIIKYNKIIIIIMMINFSINKDVSCPNRYRKKKASDLVVSTLSILKLWQICCSVQVNKH